MTISTTTHRLPNVTEVHDCPGDDHRFHAHIESKPGYFVCISRSKQNKQSVIDTVNFWDERVNSYFIDVLEENRLRTPLEAALHKLDALADKIASA